MARLIRTLLALIVAFLACNALAQDKPMVPEFDQGDKFTLTVSPYSYHFSTDKTYTHVYLVGLEREHPDNSLDGIAFFNNSFDQPTVYVFPFGQAYHGIWGVPKLSFKWTAGLLYGYLGEYKKRVPLNYNGFSPAVNIALASAPRPPCFGGDHQAGDGRGVLQRGAGDLGRVEDAEFRPCRRTRRLAAL
jgi:hypothetical protein